MGVVKFRFCSTIKKKQILDPPLHLLLSSKCKVFPASCRFGGVVKEFCRLQAQLFSRRNKSTEKARTSNR